jgi:hypothetical protein
MDTHPTEFPRLNTELAMEATNVSLNGAEPQAELQFTARAAYYDAQDDWPT